MLLTLFSYIIIPILTLYLARGTDWFATNFSSISTSLSRQGEFLLWCLITGGYFFFTIRLLFKRMGSFWDVQKEGALFWASGWMMVLFVLIPYLPSSFPFLSFIHVICALLSSIFFFICLLSLLLKAYYSTPDRYRSCLAFLIAATVFCLCAFIMTGIINTAMEICFALTGVVLVKRLVELVGGDGQG